MITIIYDEAGQDMSLQASGHAGYAPKGQDIVCAAVSTLMQSLAYSVDSGTVTCDPGGENILRVQASRSLDTLAKFELVTDGLMLLAQQYPANVRFVNPHANDADNMDLQLFADGGAGDGAGEGAAAAEGESSPAAPPALRPAQERLAKRSRPGKAAKAATEKLLQPTAGGSSLHEGAEADAERLVQEAFETHERIDAIYISSSNSIPICRYVDEHGLSDQVTIIASDIFDELNEYLRRGVVNATIFQDPFAQGYAAFEKLYYNLAENRPVPTFVTARPQIVLKSNLPLYQK
mgnify:CR=1 FL=1